MSLGVKTFWRAHVCASAASGLSLSPRDLPRVFPFCHRYQHARWHSTQTPDSSPEANNATGLDSSSSIVRRVPSKAEADLEAVQRKSSRVEVINASPSAVRRAVLRRAVKQKINHDSQNPALVKQAQWYPSKHELTRSARKSYRSKARQDLWAYSRAKEDRTGIEWQRVVSFLSKLTPTFGSIFDFKVTVGRGAADKIRGLLPRGPTAEPGQLQQSTRAIVRLDDVVNADGTLHLTLTGSAHSVRLALLDLLKASGHITAVRVLDSNSEGMLRDLWRQEKDYLNSVKLLASGEAESGDTMLTLEREQIPSEFLPQQYRPYILTRRADAIPKPAVWTRTSLETYIASLVYGIVPAHFTSSLYGGSDSLDHQQTVVSLLMDTFHDDESRRVLTAESLAMALSYIQDKKLTFRPAARAIFNQAEIHSMPMDTRICNLFTKGSAMTGDLDGFDQVLKMMARKNLHADSETWLSLLMLVEDVEAKRHILRKMRKKGLDRIQSTLVKVGGHMAPFELEALLKQTTSIRDFLNQQDALYGPLWCNQTTLNRLVDVLGKNGRLDMCKELLDFVHETRRTIPDAVTLNTIITHNRSLPAIIETIQSLQSRWPRSKLFDGDTYDLLFQIAWRNRSLNLLRVIWHYASYARQVSSKMRQRMDKFLRTDQDLGRMSLLKTWEATVVGAEAMSLLKSTSGHKLGSAIARWHGAKAHFFRTTAPLGAKLAEAYEMDRNIHAEIKHGNVVTTSTTKGSTVEIPLERKTYNQLLLVAPSEPVKAVQERLTTADPDGEKQMYYE